MAIINRGPTLPGRTIGPVGHPTFTMTLVGAKEIAAVMAQVPKSVASTALKISMQHGIKVVQEEIRKGAASLRGRWSYGVYSRSLSHYVKMDGRFHGTAVVGNLRAYREGPFQADIDAERSPYRRPAKYWHWVEWGSFNKRTGRRNRAHHLLARAVPKAMPQLKRTLEAASVEVLSRHLRVPPLVLSHAISSGAFLSEG